MAIRLTRVSDLTGEDLAAENAVEITLRFASDPEGVFKLDANESDEGVAALRDVATRQNKRGRKAGTANGTEKGKGKARA